MTMDSKLKVGPQGDREIVITRAFAAPRELVYEAYTTPALLKRWLGVFGGWELAVCEIDLREGGRYRWVWRNSARNPTDMGVSGVYREITPPERIVCTEQFDDAWYKGEALVTVTFVERDGATTLTLTLRYESTEVRDAVLKSPMEGGLQQSYDALANVLASLNVEAP
jgi:uncharacterized protein YndB with AHSA1/START domain